MACENPLLALDLGIDPETGSRKIKIMPRRVGEDLGILEYRYGKNCVLALPCGKCTACKEAYRKQWTERCICEAKLYEKNCFITLTYDELHVKKFLCREDFTVFIRELRRLHSVRYFGCGEYGEKSARIHGHFVLFGYMPDDLEPTGKSDNGVMIYKSKELESIWQKGNVIVEEFHPNNAAYVAGYVGKKLSKGTVYDDHPEFIMMSTRPGIGYEYLIQHKDEWLKYNHLIGPKGRIMKIGRYAEKILGISEEQKITNIDALRCSENEVMQKFGIVYRQELWYRKGKELENRVKHRRRKLC